MTRFFLSRVLVLAFVLVGASGISVQVTGAEEVVDGGCSLDLAQSVTICEAGVEDLDGPRFSMSLEHRSAAPELFFESEEEIREDHLPNKVTTRSSAVSTHIRSLVSEPSVFSLNDLSSVVGCGRNFHAAPPLRVVLGVFRV